MENKKGYVTPDVEFSEFEAEDILTNDSSSGNNTGWLAEGDVEEE